MLDDIYTPSDWGKRYHSLNTHEALGAGAAGPGKSLVLLMDPFQQVAVEHQRCENTRHPHHLRWGDSVGWALHLRRTSPMLDQTIARSMRIFPRIDPGAVWKASDHWWIFKSGFRYQFGHCKDPDDWQQYFSNEYTHIAFDELVQFLKEQYDQISARVRTTDPVLKNMLKVRAMSNPLVAQEGMLGIHVNDPNWVRRYFVDPAPQGNTILRKKLFRKDGEAAYRTKIYLPATLYDNPDPEFVRQYEETLLDKPSHIRRALLDGDWYAVRGAFYGDDWNPRIHIRDPFKIPKHWRAFRALDWGFKNPGCVGWYAIDDDETIWKIREFTFKEKTDVEVAKYIKEIEIELGYWKGNRSRITGPADDQLWERRGNSAKSMAENMEDNGVYWEKADKASRHVNAQRFLARLRDHKHGTVNPGIIFFSTCKMTIQTIPAIQTDPKNSETPADGGDDHWHDETLYACAYASHGSLGVSMIRDDDDIVEDKEQPQQYKGRYGYGSALC